MKTKGIITATLLTGGLILGTTSAAYAVDPAPSTNLTVASYSSQLATFNLASAAFDAATFTFRTQISTYAAALAAYKASDATLQLNYQAALKANMPANTAVKYAHLMTAFTLATTSYNTTAALFSTQSKAYQAAVQSYEMSYRAALQGYKVSIAMWGALNKTIYTNFETAVHNANAKFAIALRAAQTRTQRVSAIKARTATIKAAIAVRSAARIALGTPPIKPVQQIKIGEKVDTFVGVRPIRPVMAL